MSLVKTAILTGLFFCVLVLLPVPLVGAASEEYRQCTQGESCQIGEFLFDDLYVPITTATCTLSSRNPSGAVFFNNQAMSSQSDGWYSHTISTTGETLGTYRGSMCCTHGTEYLCTDKTFEIVLSPSGLSGSQVSSAVWNAVRADHTTVGSFGENLQNPSSLSAADIWGYPSRSLTSFGTLVADIWGYSSRSLNNVGTLISGIWRSDDRTLSSADLDTGSLTTLNHLTTQISRSTADVGKLQTKVENVSNQLTQQNNLLEQFINAPIVETVLEEKTEDIPELTAKIRETKEISRLLSEDTSRLSQQIASLNTNWDSVSYTIALSELASSTRVLGASTDQALETQPATVADQIAWLEQHWNSPVIANLATQATSALTNTTSISREIKSYGKTVISKEYLNITTGHLAKLRTVIGKETLSNGVATIDENTLFGYIQELEKKDQAIAEYSAELTTLQQNWHSYSPALRQTTLTDLKQRVLALNGIPNTEALLDKRKNDKHSQENLALALQGVLDANYQLLAKQANAVVSQTWLEHGSIVFRSLVTNPSTSISQTVPIKYALPKELKAEHIIKKDDWLTIGYNQEKDALVASGEFILQPGETKTFIIEVTDVWIISKEEVASLRKQVESLFEPLKNTSYFAQGSTIKADIEVNLDKVELIQLNTHTPEAKIRAFREASIELNAAKSKLEDLKVLVASAGSIGTVFGFVGGVQTMAVWGLIIILVAGFVFLALYMKVISRGSKSPKESMKDEPEPEPESNAKLESHSQSRSKTHVSVVSSKSELSIFELMKEIVSLSSRRVTQSGPGTKTMQLVLAVVLIAAILGIGGWSWLNWTPELVSPVVTEVKTNRLPSPSPVLESLDLTPDSLESPLLSPSPTPLLSPPPTPQFVYIVVEPGQEGVIVRQEPSATSAQVTRIWVSKKTELLDQLGDWVQIRIEGSDETSAIKGWVPQSVIALSEKNDE